MNELTANWDCLTYYSQKESVLKTQLWFFCFSGLPNKWYWVAHSVFLASVFLFANQALGGFWMSEHWTEHRFWAGIWRYVWGFFCL